MELFHVDRKDRVEATEVLFNDLIMFKRINGDLFKEMVQLLNLDDIWYQFFRSFVNSHNMVNVRCPISFITFYRKHESISEYGDFESVRKIIVLQLKNIIEANPLFIGKLKSLNIASQRLVLHHCL